jgi:lipid-A-disaccharide synthase
MIIAGEASGDLHGAKLVRAMRKKNNSLFFCGIGGQSLKDAGVRILVDASKRCSRDNRSPFQDAKPS